jgi:HD-GYP domain-containing protein (c-di-GMP phosphodiesterase class II)
MSHESAVRILESGTGTQFDESIVQAFAKLPLGLRSLVSSSLSDTESLKRLSDAVTGKEPAVPVASVTSVMEDA